MLRNAYLTLFVATLFACQPEAEAPPAERGSGSRDASTQTKPDASSGKKTDTDEPADEPADEPDGRDVGEAAALPCEVKAVLDAHCASCHADPPQFGAPMPLVSAADFQAQAPRDETVVYRAAADRIARTGPGAMPPAGQPALSDEAKTTLLNWLRDEALAGDEPCDAAPDERPEQHDDQGDEQDPDAGASEAPADEDEDAGEEPAASDCEVSFELRAHDGAGGKFPIPQEDDHYECFYFKADVDAETLATSLTPLLDDTRVLHHWLLFAADNEDEAPSGTHARCSGIHPGAYLMAAWLPGTPALVMPEDVGMEMPSGSSAQFILENHYNNTARYQGASDDSGVKVCATNKSKAQHAAIHWLGSELITLLPSLPGEAAGTCTPSTDEPIHILGVIPHMHRLGRHVTMTVQRANGARETLHEGAFEFESQAYFAKDVVLQPGDTVHTRCEYMNDTLGIVTLGEQTTNEMCYMFTLAYPVGSMNTGGDLLNPITGEPIVMGPNRCMR